MNRKTVKGSRCGKCNQFVFVVQRYMGDWMALETTLTDKGPRYALHTTPNGAAFACRESTVKGHKKHVCPNANGQPIGGHTPQLF